MMSGEHSVLGATSLPTFAGLIGALCLGDPRSFCAVLKAVFGATAREWTSLPRGSNVVPFWGVDYNS